jgi:hypothetical protein
VEPRFFSALEKSKWLSLDPDEHDVFEPQSPGRVMIAGDLYHYQSPN